MKRNILYAVFAAILLCGCSSEVKEEIASPAKEFAHELTVAESQVVEGLGQFEADFLAKTLEYNIGNVVVSPMGATMFLSMLANCTDAETSAKIADVLGCADVEACNSLASKYMDWFPKADPNVKVSFANGMWYRTGNTLNPAFSSAAANYRMDMFAEDFGDDEYLQGRIGSWADKKTGGLIKDLSMISFKDDPAVLANVIAFRGDWADPFDAEKTTKESFFGKYRTTEVAMMHSDDVMGISKSSNSLAVLLPFGANRFDLVCILPNEGTELSEVYADFEKIMHRGFFRSEVKLALPKFKISPTDVFDLTDAFSEMGLENLNFSALYAQTTEEEVDYNKAININQLTSFEVSEKGVEAATITISGMTADSGKPAEEVEMTFNRPFLFAVRERSTGLTLFAGKVVDL